MTKKQLNIYLDKYVEITFDDGRIKIGVLKISERFNTWHTLPEHHLTFKASTVKRVKIIREIKNKTPGEIKAWLLENCVDENNNINLSRLDFSDFDGDVIINHLKVSKHLYQDYQEVNGNLYQNHQKSPNCIFQDAQETKRLYTCNNEKGLTIYLKSGN